MWILIAEMLLALGVIVFIFWWTMRARIDHPAEPGEVETRSDPNTLKPTEFEHNQKEP